MTKFQGIVLAVSNCAIFVLGYVLGQWDKTPYRPLSDDNPGHESTA